MPDFLQEAADWLADELAEEVATTITYRTESGEKSIPATLGQSVVMEMKENGVAINVKIRDYIVRVADLELGGIPFKPALEHRIVDGNLTCQPLPLGEREGCYDYTNPHRKQFRIHTKVIKDTTQ